MKRAPTDDAGVASFAALAPGAYDVRASFAGFAVWLATIIIVVVGVAFYYGRRGKAKAAGAEYSTIFAEIPPE